MLSVSGRWILHRVLKHIDNQLWPYLGFVGNFELCPENARRRDGLIEARRIILAAKKEG